MAENQTASEDSGQQSQHQTHHQQQQQQQEQQQQETQQQQHNQQFQEQQQQQHLLTSTTLRSADEEEEEESNVITSPSLLSPSQENSASSPEDTESTILITNHQPTTRQQQHIGHEQQQQEQQQNQSQKQGMRSSMIDHQITNKFKTGNPATQRRNTIQTPSRATNTTAIRKPPLTKMTSLTNSGGGIGSGTVAGTVAVDTNSNSKHYQHNHNMSNNAVVRTTSESLRLNAMPTSNNDTHALSNATSNSSLHSAARMTNSSSSSSIGPRSTSNTYASQTSLSSKVTSPNNNGRSHHSHGHSQGMSVPQQRKPKTTSSSFQITSVTVGQAKKHSDNGEESADDLDESHTEDNSRITDLENDTPSMSEDTFSKDEVYYANTSLNSNAPVIPTSSQYGLVVVDPIGPALGQKIQNVQVNVSDNIINVVSAAVTPGGSKKKEDIKETQHRSERFKVVKIESTEPFRRGRWMCMDYLDHSTVGSGGKEAGNNDKTVAGDGAGGNGEPAKTTQSMIIGSGAAALLENHVDATAAGNSLQLTSANMADGNWNFGTGLEGTSPSHQQLQQQMSAPTGIATAPATVAHGLPTAHAFLNNLEQDQLQQQSAGGNFDTQTGYEQQQQQQGYNDAGGNGSEPAVFFATAAAQQLQQSLQQLKQQEEAIAAAEAAAAHNMYVPGQSETINFGHIQQQMSQQQQPSQQTSNQQAPTTSGSTTATTIPNNLHFQNGSGTGGGIIDSNQASPSSQQQSQQPTHLQIEQISAAQPTPQVQQLTYAEVAQQNAQQQQQQLSTQQQQPTAGTYVAQPQQQQQQPQQGQPQQVIYDDMHMQQQQQQQPQQHHVANTSAPTGIVVPQTLQQQLSQTDGVSTPTILQQQAQLPPQFQQTGQGQTMPILTQIPAYDMQQQPQQQQQHQHQATTMQQQSGPTQMQSAPATISDPNVLIATLQAVQQQQQQQAQQTMGIDTVIGQLQSGVGNAPSNHANTNELQQQQQATQNLTTHMNANGSNANISNIANAMNMINTNSATNTTGDDLNQQQQQQQQQQQTLQALQVNTETETER